MADSKQGTLAPELQAIQDRMVADQQAREASWSAAQRAKPAPVGPRVGVLDRAPIEKFYEASGLSLRLGGNDEDYKQMLQAHARQIRREREREDQEARARAQTETRLRNAGRMGDLESVQAKRRAVPWKSPAIREAEDAVLRQTDELFPPQPPTPPAPSKAADLLS